MPSQRGDPLDEIREILEGRTDALLPRDSKVDEAKAALMTDLFGRFPDEVFFGRQIEVRFEKQFFHWITTKALNLLGMTYPLFAAGAQSVLHAAWSVEQGAASRVVREVVAGLTKSRWRSPSFTSAAWAS